MKKTAYVMDNIVPASRELEVLLNDGYEVISSQIWETDDDQVFFAAVLVKEVR